MSEALLILTSLPDLASAQALARQLVERKLAACVNLLPAVQSVYRWQGQVEQAFETTLLIKTARRTVMRSWTARSRPYIRMPRRK